MPAPRFWEFEDAQVDFGSLDAGPTDLARMLLVEFALSYGNDWFVMPVELDVGCALSHRVARRHRHVRRALAHRRAPPIWTAPYSTWRMFQHSFTHGSGLTKPEANLFFLAPSLLQSLESAPVEEVLLRARRDGERGLGHRAADRECGRGALSRYEAEVARNGDVPSSPVRRPGRRPRCATGSRREFPSYWVPLLPVQTGAGLRLQRGAVLDIQGVPRAVPALGRIIESGHALSLFEEEVPREGARVTRSYQWTRWTDGSSHLWIGRRKGVGRGEGSSSLRFDVLDRRP